MHCFNGQIIASADVFSCCHFHTQTLVWWSRASCFWACYNLRQICVGRFLAQRCLLVLRCLIFCQNSFKQFNGSQRVILTSAPGSTRVPDEVLLGYWHNIAWVIGEQVWTISISLDFRAVISLHNKQTFAFNKLYTLRPCSGLQYNWTIKPSYSSSENLDSRGALFAEYWHKN